MIGMQSPLIPPSWICGCISPVDLACGEMVQGLKWNIDSQYYLLSPHDSRTNETRKEKSIRTAIGTVLTSSMNAVATVRTVVSPVSLEWGEARLTILRGSIAGITSYGWDFCMGGFLVRAFINYVSRDVWGKCVHRWKGRPFACLDLPTCRLVWLEKICITYALVVIDLQFFVRLWVSKQRSLPITFFLLAVEYGNVVPSDDYCWSS